MDEKLKDEIPKKKDKSERAGRESHKAKKLIDELQKRGVLFNEENIRCKVQQREYEGKWPLLGHDDELGSAVEAVFFRGTSFAIRTVVQQTFFPITHGTFNL